jgi:hypothetical protein
LGTAFKASSFAVELNGGNFNMKNFSMGIYVEHESAGDIDYGSNTVQFGTAFVGSFVFVKRNILLNRISLAGVLVKYTSPTL